MKKASSYKMRIPVGELLDYPNAWLTRDILSQTGATVLIPCKVPISKLSEGLDNPRKMIESLERMRIKTVDIEIPQDDEMDDEEILTRLKELDPTVVLIDSKVTQEAQTLMDDIFHEASEDDKFNLPKERVEDLGKSLSNEIRDVSQIAISLLSGGEDQYTQTHAVNVSMLSGYIAKKLIEEGKAPASLLDKTILAGLLFDIGKTAIPKEILHKKGELTPAEMKVARGHIEESLSICKEAGVTDKDILDGIATHHERYDGSGYPRGLVGTQIPLIGRILAVADTFDAMTSPRVYKNAVSSKLSFNFIMSANETSFDPDICKIFIAGMGVYPPGSVVLLSDGRKATVVGMTTGNLLQPKVKIKDEDSVIDLAQAKLFIKQSLDTEIRDSELLLEIEI